MLGWAPMLPESELDELIAAGVQVKSYGGGEELFAEGDALLVGAAAGEVTRCVELARTPLHQSKIVPAVRQVGLHSEQLLVGRNRFARAPCALQCLRLAQKRSQCIVTHYRHRHS